MGQRNYLTTSRSCTVTTVSAHNIKSKQMAAHPEKRCSGCWMVRPDTVVTGWMGNICYHVSNIPQWRLVDGGHHTPVVTGVWCIEWVSCHFYIACQLLQNMASSHIKVKKRDWLCILHGHSPGLAVMLLRV